MAHVDGIMRILEHSLEASEQLTDAHRIMSELIEECYDNHDYGSRCLHCGEDQGQPHREDCPIILAQAWLDTNSAYDADAAVERLQVRIKSAMDNSPYKPTHDHA